MQNTSDFAELFAKELHAIRKKFSHSADQSAPEKNKVNSSHETESFLLNSDDKSCEKLSRDQFREACSSDEKLTLQGDFSTKVVVPSGNGDEPFVGYTPVNLVALCFSGGGIRSSTFNLGVLQGLSEIGLLPEFDYLSTVSGGGYVGSWWTAWRHRNTSLERSERIPVTGTNQPEPEEISWLRQRGNFLSPSTGIWHGELWRGLFLFLIGLSMTLTASVSLLALASIPFLLIANFLDRPYLTLSVPGVLLIFTLVIAFTAICSSKAKRPSRERLAIWLWGVTLCTLLMALSTWVSLEWPPILSFLTSSVATATAGAVFFKFGSVLSRRDLNERPSAISLSIGRLIPRVLALVGVVGLAIIASTATQFTLSWFGGSLWHYAGLTVGLVVLAVVSSTLSSNFPTLHAFYRSRITRTFLSPPNEGDETDASDCELSSLGNGMDPERPIHVINCCRNEVDGTVLKRRGRNGVSATVSPFGCCVGNASTNQNKITLATAVTVSAAATNPFMGQYTAQLGRAVSFLMAALNFRLGIWLHEPRPVLQTEDSEHAKIQAASVANASTQKRWLDNAIGPGRFLAELMGVPTYRGLMHLSDGGHFENLGLYEMIRRQCRYILVSDCGADPATTFAEFAHLQRLVRQDFGVEIEINLDVLREGANGLSSQHMVAGTIQYPGLEGNNRGILIYIKPSITGDEPEDVTQYRSSNKTFPHESTVDQFYDSAQWESYRQLGYHSILTGFSFRSGYEKADITKAPRVFEAAAREWMPSGKRQSWDSGKRFAGPTNPPVSFVRSIFPEVDENHESISELITVFDSLQTLEREFENRNLSKNMDCLDNWGWINWADRLVASDTVRRWWPFISPLFNVRFRNELMDDALGLNSVQAFYADIHKHSRLRKICDNVLAEMDGPAVQRWRSTYGHQWQMRLGEHFMITFSLPSPLKQPGGEVQLGSLFFSLVPQNDTEVANASGTSIVFYDGDIQVSPGHWSVGIQAKLLDVLMMQLKNGTFAGDRAINSIQVLPNSQLTHKNEPSGEVERPNLLHFYLKRGFIRRFDGVLEKPLGDVIQQESLAAE